MSTDHHGSSDFPFNRRGPLYEGDPSVEKRLRDMNARNLGEFPRGKLTEHDEGSIAFAIGVKNGAVVVNFPKPVAWFGMPPANAVELAKLLIAHARLADPTLIVEITL